MMVQHLMEKLIQKTINMLYLMEKHWLFMMLGKKLQSLQECLVNQGINLRNIKIKKIPALSPQGHMLRVRKIFINSRAVWALFIPWYPGLKSLFLEIKCICIDMSIFVMVITIPFGLYFVFMGA